MKEDLTINIGSKYNGEGFKKVNQALKDTSKTVNSASKAIGSISNELGQMGGAAGKAANAVSGLFQSFMAGGPVALIIAGVTAAVSLLVKAFNDAKERAKEAAEAMRNSFKNAFDKSSDAAQRFFDKLGEMKSTNKMVQQEIDFQSDVESREKAVGIKKQAYVDRGAALNDIEKQKVSAKEKRDLALQQLESKNTAASVNVVKAVKNRDIAQQEQEAKASEVVAFEQTMKDMDKLLDKKLVDEFHQLEDAVGKATQDVVKNGRESTAYMAQKSHVTSSGTAYTTEYAVTYGEVLEDAAHELEKFKKEHEEVIKDLDAYKEAAKKLDALKVQLAKLTHAYEEAEQATRQATLLASSTVPKENAAEKLRIEEQYQKEIAALEEQEKAIKNAAKQYADSMNDAIKAQEEKMKEVPAAFGEFAEEIQKAEEELKKLKAAEAEVLSKLKKAKEVLSDPEATTTEKIDAKYDAADAQKKLNELDKPLQDAKKRLADLNTKNLAKEIENTEEELKKLKEAQIEAFSKFKEAAAKAVEVVNDPNAKKTDKDEAKNAAADAQKKLNELDKPLQDAKKKLLDLTNKQVSDEQKRLRQQQKDVQNSSKEKLDKLAQAEKQLADEMNKAKDKLAKIEAGWAGNLNVDGGFGKWQHGEDEKDNDDKKKKKQAANNQNNAQNQQAQLANNIFKKNGEVRKGANLIEVGRFSDITDYLGGEGMSPEQESGLRDYADKLKSKLFDKDGNLKKGKENTREYSVYEKIKDLLDKKDVQQEADMKQQQLIDIQTQQRELADQTKQTLDNIAGTLAKITEKIGI